MGKTRPGLGLGGWKQPGWGAAAVQIPPPTSSQVCKEKHRFERLMDYFRNEDSSIDFMVPCPSPGHPWGWVGG